jgi:hypothetical protein
MYKQPDVQAAIALQLFTPQECFNFVGHCGYRMATAL